MQLCPMNVYLMYHFWHTLMKRSPLPSFCSSPIVLDPQCSGELCVHCCIDVRQWARRNKLRALIPISFHVVLQDVMGSRSIAPNTSVFLINHITKPPSYRLTWLEENERDDRNRWPCSPEISECTETMWHRWALWQYFCMYLFVGATSCAT